MTFGTKTNRHHRSCGGVAPCPHASAYACAVFLAILCGMAATAVAQTTFQEFPTHAQIRATAIAHNTGRVFAAAYDANEVLELDPATGTAKKQVKVGAGPASLALSADGTTLACVNRLDGTLSLISVADLRVTDTVPCGKAPTNVAALPGGGFAVANTFSNSLTIVDLANPKTPATLDKIGGLPIALAASANWLVVATRMPSALHFLAPGSTTPAITVTLHTEPNAVATLSDGRFVVATKAGLVLVDAADQIKQAIGSEEYYDVVASRERIAAVKKDVVELYTGGLALAESVPINSGTRAITLDGDFLVACAPAAKLVAIAGHPAVIEQLAPPVSVTSMPATQPTAQQVVPVEAAPAEQPAPKTNTEVVAPPTPTLPAPELPEAQPAPASAVSTESEETKASSLHAFRRMPVTAPGSRAPFVSRPSPLPTLGPPKASLGQALSEGLKQQRSEGGFKTPDWTHPWRDISADNANFSKDFAQGTATGNVRLQIEDTDFRADSFTYDEAAGKITAAGDVTVTQPTASLTARDLEYTYPLELRPDQKPAPLTQAESTDEQTMAKKRLALGKIVANGIKVYEPTRGLQADHLEYDFANETGAATNIKGQYGAFYFGAAKLRILGPASADGEDVWVTTCDQDPPHYRIRMKHVELQADQTIAGHSAQLKVGSANTPIYWPKWAYQGGEQPSLNFDFHSGRRAEIGAYINTGQRFNVSPDFDLGSRIFLSTKGGVGAGVEGDYDYMETPTSPLFRGKGSFESLYTTKERGYAHAYHRQEIDENTVLLMQVEQWSDKDFYKDFFNAYKDRTEPRTFVNLTHTQPGYIAEATVKKNTNGFVYQTERLPELSFHLIERPLLDNVYTSFDTVDGYLEREPSGQHSVRSINVGRLSYDWDIAEAINLAPFVEVEGSWYSGDAPRWYAFDQESDSAFRFATTTGLTAQTRLHREYPGALGFDAFKHIILPSVTYSYRPEPTMSVQETPRFDAWDNVYGRSRLETKLANIVLGRDITTKQVWQVASLTLYQGVDFWNEVRKSRDYEVEMDLRPRAYWGWLAAGERHTVDDQFSFDQPFVLPSAILQLYERVKGEQLDPEAAYRFSARYGDYNRLLTYFYYDGTPVNGRFNGRFGFTYTETQGRVFNREVLYGAGYRLGEKWSVGFEHRYDLSRDKLVRQLYEIRRDLHCWEGALQFNDRPSGWDVGVELSIKGLPGSRLQF